jgi:hypothetical protein
MTRLRRVVRNYGLTRGLSSRDQFESGHDLQTGEGSGIVERANSENAKSCHFRGQETTLGMADPNAQWA